MATCDRVAVLKSGVLHQCATPRQLVRKPATAFVGRFVLQGNLLPARWRNGRVHTLLGMLDVDGEPLQTPNGSGNGADSEAESLEVLVKPDGIDFQPDPSGSARVRAREFLGHQWMYQVQTEELNLRLRLPLEQEFPLDASGRMGLRKGGSARLFPSGLDLRVAA